MRIVPAARVLHYHEMNWRSFWRQHFHYGRGAHQYWKCQAQRTGKGFKVEPPGFYLNMLWYPWRNGVSRPARVAALLVVSQMANALGYFAARLAK